MSKPTIGTTTTEKNSSIRNIGKAGYFKENIVNIAVSLIAYYFFGFQITLVIMLAAIMSDIGMILKKAYEE